MSASNLANARYQVIGGKTKSKATASAGARKGWETRKANLARKAALAQTTSARSGQDQTTGSSGHAMLATNIQTDPFLDILDEMRRLHISKGHDYGTDADNTSNLRASQRFGIPPWVGCVLRANDKLSRIESFITKGRLDFGPWEQVFYGEFDGNRRKRVLVKIIGE